MPEKNIVGIAKVKHPQNKSEIESALFNLVDEMKERNKIKIPSNAKVMIKPNICLVRGYETSVSVTPLLLNVLWIGYLKTGY